MAKLSLAGAFGKTIGVDGPVAGDSIVNATEAAAGVTLSGTSTGFATGSVVTIRMTGTSTTWKTTVDSAGKWRITIPGLSAFADGTYTFTATLKSGLISASTTAQFALDRTPPAVVSMAVTSPSLVLGVGAVATLSVVLNEAVTASGALTLTLNNGGTATYVSGSGNTLVFSYRVLAGQDTSRLAVTAIGLNGGSILDRAGNQAELSVLPTLSGAPSVDTTAPTVTSVTTPADVATLVTGQSVSFTVVLSEAVMVSGAPILMLNDGGTASYVSGSGGNVLVFSHTVAAGQTATDLAVTGINLNGGTIADAAGNAANMTGVMVNPAGTLAVNPEPPREPEPVRLINGTSNNDTLSVDQFVTHVDGGAGIDVAWFTWGSVDDFLIATAADGSQTVQDRNAPETVINLRDVETFRFADGTSYAVPDVSQAGVLRTVYIDPSASGPADGSIDHPFQNWYQFALEPGTQYLLKAGTVHDGPLVLWGVGTTEAPIVVGSYGTGPAPVITGSVVIEQSAYLTLRDFTIQGSGYPGVVVRDGAHHIGIVGNTIQGNGLGIWFGADSGGGNIVRGNLISGNTYHGVAFDGSDHRSNPTLVTGNVIRDNGSHGVEIHANGVIVDNNQVIGNGLTVTGSSGIHVFGGFTTADGFGFDNMILGNTVTGTREAGSGYDGNGIQLDRFSGSNIVENNTVTDNDGAGIILYDSAENQIVSNTVIGNALDHNGSHAWRGEVMLATDIDLLTDLTASNVISGNTITTRDPATVAFWVDMFSADNGNLFGDNLVSRDNGGEIYTWGGSLGVTGSDMGLWNASLAAGAGDDVWMPYTASF